MATVLRTTGIRERLTLNRKDDVREQLRRPLGGYFEPVPGYPLLWINADALDLALPVNEGASAISGSVIVGDAVLFDHGDEGLTLGLVITGNDR